MSTVTVKVDGRPEKDVIAEQIADEIQEVRESENKFRMKRSVKTKHNGNHSGAKTTPGYVVYSAGQKATHVMFKGEVFPWQAKAPYVPSGCSVSGGFEYDKETEELRCHECGEWRRDLGIHIGTTHRIKTRDYRLRHGINLDSVMTGPTLRSAKAASVAKVRPQSKNLRMNWSTEREQKRISTRRERLVLMEERGLVARTCQEALNLRNTCEAQKLNTIKLFAKELGRAPTAKEMNEYTDSDGRRPIAVANLITMFGVPRSVIFQRVGLAPLKRGHSVHARQPVPLKTHCRRGHLFTTSNTGWHNNSRYCLICDRAAANRRAATKRERAAFQTASMNSITR